MFVSVVRNSVSFHQTVSSESQQGLRWNSHTGMSPCTGGGGGAVKPGGPLRHSCDNQHHTGTGTGSTGGSLLLYFNNRRVRELTENRLDIKERNPQVIEPGHRSSAHRSQSFIRPTHVFVQWTLFNSIVHSVPRAACMLLPHVLSEMVGLFDDGPSSL